MELVKDVVLLKSEELILGEWTPSK